MGRVFLGGGKPDMETPVPLPSGYSLLEYIQSSGAQYIDTGFVPNANTRIVMDCEVLTFTTAAYLGCCTATSSSAPNTNALIMINGTSVRSDYYGSVVSSSGVASGRHTVDRNANVTTIGANITINNAASSNVSNYNLFICARNAIGTADLFMSMKLYSCQVYDNGTMVRDFIPCISDAGVVGLFDLCGRTFYGSAGSGAFIGSEVA